MCQHSIDDSSHDLCHTHAYCAKEGKYYAAICATCEDLWYRSKDFDDPEDAIVAFDALTAWIRGFRRNSKGRPAGQDYFYDPHERAQFQELHAMVANLRAVPDLDASAAHQPRPLQRSATAAPSW